MQTLNDVTFPLHCYLSRLIIFG